MDISKFRGPTQETQHNLGDFMLHGLLASGQVKTSLCPNTSIDINKYLNSQRLIEIKKPVLKSLSKF